MASSERARRFAFLQAEISPHSIALMKQAVLLLPVLATSLLSLSAEDKPQPTGYSDTPILPQTGWKIHDIDRPRPEIVTPGKDAAAPPSDAIVLFDGGNLSEWFAVKGGGEAKWKVENGYVEMVPTGDIQTKREFGDMQLHIEFMSPNPPQSNSQKRGNSGIFLMGLYELQVLDCFDNLTYADGQAGGIYGQYPPLVNPSRKPGEWQTYDVVWRAPKFEGQKLVKPGTITVLLNGVLTLANAEILGPTNHKTLPAPKAHGNGPIRLQDHGDKQQVRFRNIWVREIKSHADQVRK